jgi:hypothetical protein
VLGRDAAATAGGREGRGGLGQELITPLQVDSSIGFDQVRVIRADSKQHPGKGGGAACDSVTPLQAGNISRSCHCVVVHDDPLGNHRAHEGGIVQGNNPVHQHHTGV